MRHPLVLLIVTCLLGVLTAPATAQAATDAGQSPAAPVKPIAKCDSPIYCPGPLLDRIQRAKLYPDSKTFVDKPTLKPLSTVLSSFAALPPTASNTTLLAFINENFGPVGTELESITPSDWKPTPAFLSHIKDKTLKEYAETVHGYWKDLTRVMKNETTACEGDTYFVFEGLALSEMYETMHGMIDNFIDLVNEFGFVPNGARIYYLNRSQPPLLTQMVSTYLTATNDTSSLRRWTPALDAEYAFWINNRTVDVTHPDTKKCHKLARYAVLNSHPRPESYAEDVETVEGGGFKGAQAEELYADIASAAE
ncbi:hypothetical protein HK104_006353, partial [Borealophlyctis nickersoniae]